MKVRRIRYVPQFQTEDTNPYIPEKERPRMVWRDWVEVAVYEDAEIRQLDLRHYPAGAFQLRVPLKDPETGTMRDADGDRALLRIEMVGASVDIFNAARPAFKGFVSKEDLAYEVKYRAGERADGSIGTYHYTEADNARSDEYVHEEWQVLSSEREETK